MASKSTLGKTAGGVISVIVLAFVLISNTCKDKEGDVSSTSSPSTQEVEAPTKVSSPNGSKEAPVVEGGRARTLPNVPVGQRGNRKIASFVTAKNHMYDLHEDGGFEQTLYCGCTYRNRRVSLGSCGYKIRTNAERANRTEAEHVVPASLFGHTFSAWTKGDRRCGESRGKPKRGRSCAQKVSRDFALMEADLYNLQPTIGEVNGDRRDYRMAEIDGEPRLYGRCDVEIDSKRVEPRESVRGLIARTYFYMAWAYPDRVRLEDSEIRLLKRWDREHPADKWEVERAKRIKQIQGNVNPFVP